MHEEKKILCVVIALAFALEIMADSSQGNGERP